MMIANPQNECMQRETLASLQFSRLQKTLQWVQGKTSFYAALFQSKGVSSLTLKEMADFAKFPWTTAAALQTSQAMDRLTLPLSGVLRASCLQGNSGKAWNFYTNGDVAHNVEMMTRALVANGVHNASMVAVLGEMSDSRVLDLQYALEVLGALVLPLGGREEDWQDLLAGFAVDTIAGPSQDMGKLLAKLQAAGKSLGDYGLRKVICLQDQPEALPVEAEDVQVTRLLAPLVAGSGAVFYPCAGEDGFLVQEDAFYVELIAAAGQEIVEENQAGEVVLTSLTAEAMPLLRYRTGWQAQWLPASATGRTFRRLAFL